jgi:hypothetical protein
MVEKDILRLEITIDNITGMQVIQGKCDLRGVKFSHGIWEALEEKYRNGFKGEKIFKELTFDRRRRVKSSPPGTKSMTMYKFDAS